MQLNKLVKKDVKAQLNKMQAEIIRLFRLSLGNRQFCPVIGTEKSPTLSGQIAWGRPASIV